MPSVKHYEPMMALDGGTDGLTFYRLISTKARQNLNEGGMILVEIGFDQGHSVSELFKAEGYRDIRIYKDYAGHDRVIEAKCPQ